MLYFILQYFYNISILPLCSQCYPPHDPDNLIDCKLECFLSEFIITTKQNKIIVALNLKFISLSVSMEIVWLIADADCYDSLLLV